MLNKVDGCSEKVRYISYIVYYLMWIIKLYTLRTYVGIKQQIQPGFDVVNNFPVSGQNMKIWERRMGRTVWIIKEQQCSMWWPPNKGLAQLSHIVWHLLQHVSQHPLCHHDWQLTDLPSPRHATKRTMIGQAQTCCVSNLPSKTVH